MGDWSFLGYPCTGSSEIDNAYTFQAQGSFVLPLAGQQGRYIFMGDQWDPEDLGSSRWGFCLSPRGLH